LQQKVNLEKPIQLAAYNFVVPETVVWGDMDVMGHVNNTQYFRYMETARFQLVSELFPHFSEPDAVHLSTTLALAEINCRFKSSLRYPDEILIGVGVCEIQESQFLIRHEIYSAKMDRIAAQGDARMVYYDFKAKNKAPIPEQTQKRLQDYSLD